MRWYWYSLTAANDSEYGEGRQPPQTYYGYSSPKNDRPRLTVVINEESEEESP